MLRKPQRAQQTPLSAKAWEEYLGSHFQVPRDQQPPGQGAAARARERVAARDMAVPLGHNHPPPEVLLNQGVQRAWMPEPGVVAMPSVHAIEVVLVDIVKKKNVHASSKYVWQRCIHSCGWSTCLS